MLGAMRALLVAAVLVCGCTSSRGEQHASSAAEGEAGAAPRSRAPSVWASKLGQTVTVEGDAQNAKLGALLETSQETVWIDGMQAWPDGIMGQRVRVTGRVIERRDLPVFVRRKGEPEIQGMPVPAGTDLDAASRRFLLADARWQRVLE
jgi:hypothetical protein